MPDQNLPLKVIMLGVLEAKEDSAPNPERPYRLKRAYQIWPLSGVLRPKKQKTQPHMTLGLSDKLYFGCIIAVSILVQILVKHFGW